MKDVWSIPINFVLVHQFLHIFPLRYAARDAPRQMRRLCEGVCTLRYTRTKVCIQCNHGSILGCPNLGRPAILGKSTSLCHFRAIHNSVQFPVAAFVTHCPSDSADAQVGIGGCAGLELNLNSRFGQLNVGTAGQLGRQHSEWRLRQSPTVRRGCRLTLHNVSGGAGSLIAKAPARNVAIRPIPVRNPLPSVLKSPL